MKRLKKVRSKRKTLGFKYKIEKKVREHHRKLRKLAKKNKQTGARIQAKSKQLNDFDVPNTCVLKPLFVEQYLAERSEQKEAVRSMRRGKAERRRGRKHAVQPTEETEQEKVERLFSMKKKRKEKTETHPTPNKMKKTRSWDGCVGILP
eukprot:TRINITY_DN93596_c0_g1_i1.p1 TRINITY_DN93596_c0_g1~~TRINITY_DN93596_c0_g1_i1.p1  ORF type:complete len:162 (-),score=25.42 TRINITY_DN93596_c0_g1_i1:927-1373(-)